MLAMHMEGLEMVISNPFLFSWVQDLCEGIRERRFRFLGAYFVWIIQRISFDFLFTYLLKSVIIERSTVSFLI